MAENTPDKNEMEEKGVNVGAEVDQRKNFTSFTFVIVAAILVAIALIALGLTVYNESTTDQSTNTQQNNTSKTEEATEPAPRGPVGSEEISEELNQIDQDLQQLNDDDFSESALESQNTEVE